MYPESASGDRRQTSNNLGVELVFCNRIFDISASSALVIVSAMFTKDTWSGGVPWQDRYEKGVSGEVAGTLRRLEVSRSWESGIF